MHHIEIFVIDLFIMMEFIKLKFLQFGSLFSELRNMYIENCLLLRFRERISIEKIYKTTSRKALHKKFVDFCSYVFWRCVF